MSELSDRQRRLRERLMPLARGRIERHGLAALRARDLAADAGCALGTIYNAFCDLDELVLHVNSATLAELDRALSAAVRSAEASGATPTERLVALAEAYLGFAADHGHLWAALFEHRMPADRPVPEWHLREHDVLFRHIAEPLGELMKDPSPDALRLKARTLFSAVHGVVMLGMEKRFVAVPTQQLRSELAGLVRACAPHVGAQA